jgi:hypothetical protein
MIKKLAVLLAASAALLSSAKADTVTNLWSSPLTTNNSVAQGLINAGATQDIIGNSAWAAPLGGSSWISFTTTGDTSNSNFYTVPNNTSVTFEQDFSLNGTITGAYLDVLADDTTSVVLNGYTLFSANPDLHRRRLQPVAVAAVLERQRQQRFGLHRYPEGGQLFRPGLLGQRNHNSYRYA